MSPMILLLATVGAYAVRRLVIDVFVMFVAGVLGFFLRRSGYSVAGIVLGLIRGKIGEQTFAQAMQMLHFEWSGFFDHPIALALIIAGFLTICGSIYGAFFKEYPPPAGGRLSGLKRQFKTDANLAGVCSVAVIHQSG
ncbi:tripartite tricarboxylate transporter permease [Gammaproteobacteria bacterium]|nr:tripartite tricarboxylate transporter permease [Gammaproteobacteria bacterium]